MAQVHRGTMSPAPLSALARRGHYAFRRYIVRRRIIGCVTAKFPAELDRVVLYIPQLLLGFDVLSISFVWIRALLEVDPVWKARVSVQVKVDDVVVISLEETCTNLCDEVRDTNFVFFGKIATDKTGLAVSSSGERCTPCSIEPRAEA